MRTHEALSEYDEMLDEFVEPVFGIYGSRILKTCDPIAYRTGFNDWLDSRGIDSDELED